MPTAILNGVPEPLRETPRRRTCTWSRCTKLADARIDGWLFLGPIDYCDEHAGMFLRELIRMGWTFPFRIAVDLKPAR